MAAKVISVLNQKGGSSKTTTATNLASCLAVKHGFKVLLVDLNHDQSSATDWAASRAEVEGDPGLIPVIAMGKNVARDLPRVSGGYDFVIIDGIPTIDEITAASIKAADLALIPIQPSQYDIWATVDLVQLVKDRRELTDGQPEARLLITRAVQGTRIERNAAEALEGFELPIMQAKTHHRVDYVEGVGQGLSVMDLPADNKARLEVEAITDELLEVLKV